ncbi:SEL1-like repeat protein [Romboutsia lituseburensis]|uniref:SEL1-like repeat protein n=1 Tax=Romboutsia lituseburensis TaxID=1537 RepID=UPI00215A5E8F|nr:SEL1-like repeat protein [Romboutsia lituseburensis]MCR8746372.1 SEL1-like repeat protein [Romboutsia lituseburensis]
MDFINVKNFFLNDGLKFFNLANSYYYGINVDKDIIKAYNLYLKSASLGVCEAQNMVGIMNFNGEGISPNTENGIKYFEKASSQGNTTSMFNLAMIYLSDENKKDYKKAYEYLIKLADLGYILANDVLGYMYFEGLADEKSYDKALSYWNKSIESQDISNTSNETNNTFNSPDLKYEELVTNNNINSTASFNNLEYTIGTIDNFEELPISKNKTCTINQISPQEVDSDLEKMTLGDSYFNGTNVDIDYVKAFDIYKELAESGNINAQIKIANMYKDGLGVNQDYYKSIEWYSKAIGSQI